MDDNTRKTLAATQHPTLVSRLLSIAPDPARPGGEAHVRLSGSLSVKGIERPVTVEARLEKVANGVRVTGSVPLLARELGEVRQSSSVAQVRQRPGLPPLVASTARTSSAGAG